MRGSQSWKQMWFQLPPKGSNVFILFYCYYFLLSEVCLAACSRGWVKHCGMTLLLNIFVLFCLGSRQIQRCSVCKRKRSGENRVDFSTGNVLGSPRINVFWVRCHCLISRSLGSLKHKSVTHFAVWMRVGEAFSRLSHLADDSCTVIWLLGCYLFSNVLMYRTVICVVTPERLFSIFFSLSDWCE